MTRLQIVSLITLIITIVAFILGFQQYIGFLPMLIVNGLVFFDKKNTIKNSAIYKISCVVIVLTLFVETIALIANLNEVIGIICLFINSIVCINLSGSKAGK